MDISVLPNNNRPEKFLQLDVGRLPATHGMFQVGAAISSRTLWQNRVYSQKVLEHRRTAGSGSPPSPRSPVAFVDGRLDKHITPLTLTSTIKRNPLYADARLTDGEAGGDQSKPSWTVQEFDTQTIHGNLASFLKEEEKTPKDLDFWLEDLYTPGFDSLLKKKEAEQRRRRLCKLISAIGLSVCAVLVVIIVPVVLLRSEA